MLTPHQLAQLRRMAPENRNRLAAAIDLADVTQVQVATAVGSSQSRISSICAGRFGQDGLPLETTRGLADYFGCTVDDLFPAKSEVA